MTATKIQPGDDTHLTLLMAPHSLNFVTGADRAALLAYGRDVFAAARDSKCLAQIEEPAQPVAPVLDDRWKARMLDGRAIERDEMGLGDHPELPRLDEGMKPRGFFAALGLELTHTMAEDQLDWEVLGVMSDAVNWTDWQPTAPQGDGWKLVAIFDTEDGPAAWWLRELAEAEDGTTTIRNLQAEVEKLNARIARASRAGAAPAAVAPQGVPVGVIRASSEIGVAPWADIWQWLEPGTELYAEQHAAVAPFGYVNTHTGQFFTDVEPCRKNNEGHWRTVYLQPAAVAGPAWGEQQVHALATHMAASAPPSHKPRDYDADMAWARSALGFIAGHAQAAPALEAPAAPSEADIAAAREHIADVHNATQMRSALSQLRHEVVVELVARGLVPSIYAPMAAAPQAPAAPVGTDEVTCVCGSTWERHGHAAWLQPAAAELRRQQAEVESLRAERDEADRRAGAAERSAAAFHEDNQRFEQVRRRMKEQWGVHDNVSFDLVWQQALDAKQALAELEARKPLPLSDEQIDDLHGEANRGFDIGHEEYFKAFRDAERAHGIKET